MHAGSKAHKGASWEATSWPTRGRYTVLPLQFAESKQPRVGGHMFFRCLPHITLHHPCRFRLVPVLRAVYHCVLL